MTNNVSSKQLNSPEVFMICALFQMWWKYSCSQEHAQNSDSNSEKFSRNYMNTVDTSEYWTAKCIRNVCFQENDIELMKEYSAS